MKVSRFSTYQFFLLVSVPYFQSGKFINPLSAGAIENYRYLGGDKAKKGFAPYQVSLQTLDGWHFCGGAIIDKDWIITASHCVVSRRSYEIVVATGTNQWREPLARYHVKNIFKHNNFDQNEHRNDIALLHLNRSIIIDCKTRPIALPQKQLNDNETVIFTGWGSPKAWDDFASDLYNITLKFFNYENCQTMMKNDPDLDIGHICTFTRIGEGLCHGDSGGPLIRNGQLVGISNWGEPCGVGVPDVYANVFYYKKWVREIMRKN